MTTSIKVQRETYEKDGKQYHAYFIEGVLRGIPFRAGVKPPDFGGYTVLDIVYAGGNCADLVVTPYEIKTEDGNVNCRQHLCRADGGRGDGRDIFLQSSPLAAIGQGAFGNAVQISARHMGKAACNVIAGRISLNQLYKRRISN